MRNITKETYVDMEEMLGQIAIDHRIPYLRFDQLVRLGECAVRVYKVDFKIKRVSFDDMCQHIKNYLSTPFGKKMLKEILRK